MKPDPILEELWKIKDDLAREAGYDTRRFLENLRQWEAEHPHPGRVVKTAEELRQLVAEEERKRAPASDLLLKDEPQHPET
jgi:hypothetical protein